MHIYIKSARNAVLCHLVSGSKKVYCGWKKVGKHWLRKFKNFWRSASAGKYVVISCFCSSFSISSPTTVWSKCLLLIFLSSQHIQLNTAYLIFQSLLCNYFQLQDFQTHFWPGYYCEIYCNNMQLKFSPLKLYYIFTLNSCTSTK